MVSKWDIRFIKLAEHVASWSKDHTKVGAVITRGNKIVSLGYNGFPSGLSDDNRLNDRNLKLKIILHAEENAILSANTNLTGCTLYTHPLHPCSLCATKIIQVGINKVYSRTPSETHAINYDLELTKSLFDEAGVALEFID